MKRCFRQLRQRARQLNSIAVLVVGAVVGVVAVALMIYGLIIGAVWVWIGALVLVLGAYRLFDLAVWTARSQNDDAGAVLQEWQDLSGPHS